MASLSKLDPTPAPPTLPKPLCDLCDTKSLPLSLYQPQAISVSVEFVFPQKPCPFGLLSHNNTDAT